MPIRPRPPVPVDPPLAPGPPAVPLRIPDLRTDVARAVRSPNALRPVTIGLPPSLYEDYLLYAQSQGHPLAGLLRRILTEGLPAAIGGVGRGGGAAPQGLGGVARRTP